MITGETLRHGLKTRILGNRVISFETIDSTNTCAQAVAGCGALEGTIVFAERQTLGRGRLGRQWTANPNENLTFSIILRPSMAPDQLQGLPLLVAVALAQAIQQEAGLKVECKWPNDLLIGRRKVAGILIEGSVKQQTVEHVVVGIGMNVNQTQFPADLAEKATSLRIECGHTVDRVAMFRGILHSLEHHYRRTLPSGMTGIIPLWLDHTTMLNKEVSVLQHGSEAITGIMKGLSPEGGMVLLANGTERVLLAGDTTVLGMAT